MNRALCYRRLDTEYARLLLTGQDRVRFLHGMVTCDVKGLSEGSGAYGTLLTVKGKVISDLVVSHRGAAGLFLTVRAQAVAKVCESLERYIIVDDAVITNESAALVQLGVYGAAARAVVLGDAGANLAPYHHVEREDVTILLCEELGPGSLHVVGSAAAVAAIERQLVEAGATQLSPEEAEILRIEAGRPRFGVDFDEERLPQEAGLDDALSFTKGCFLGQEVVVRLRDRGQLNRKLVALTLSGGGVPPVHSKLSHPSRPHAGELTSIAVSPRCGAIALGYVHRTCWEPGTQLEVTDAEGHSLGCTATITELPFPER